MLWELKQLERRRAEIENEVVQVKSDRKMSVKRKAARLAELNREDTEAFVRRQRLLSLIGEDRQLSKMLDQERSRSQIKPLPEAQQGVRETSGQLPPEQVMRTKLRAKQKEWHEKSVTDRNIEASLLLDREGDAGWEPD